MLYNSILNEHAPLKETVVRGKQIPHMTEQWRRAIRHRNKLWRLFIRDRTDTNYDQYKIQHNICTSLKRKAIKEHFVKKSSEPENPREFWNAYRPFLHGKTKQANDKREIAELFNAYFIQIADRGPPIKEIDYGQHFEDHPSIRAIYERKRATGAPPLSKVATPVPGKWDRSHLCLRRKTNLIKQITGLSLCYLCSIISTRGYWLRSWVNSIARFCRILLVLRESSTAVRLHYCG